VPLPVVNLAAPGFPFGLYIEVETKEACYHFCPNNLINEAFEGLPHFIQPCTSSELSGLPGYIYRTANYDGNTVALHLTREEMYRMLSLSFTPDEYRRIRDKHGIFHEIHDDFYDDDGTAIQPKSLPTLPTVEQLAERN
jgi:hypothetical protein